MTIKPVLVPDHDAATLRKLMDHFSEATTGPTRQELTESRSAVAAAQGVSEGKRADRYHIVKKDGKPANLASYADRAGAVKDRDEKYPGATVQKVGPRGKVKDVTESDSETVDMTGKKCTACKKGTYQETSQHDDMDGVLHCNKCRKEVKRHQSATSKKKNVSESIEFPSALWVRSNMNLNNDQAHHLLHNFAKQIAAQHGLQDKIQKIESLAQQAAISSGDHTEAGAKFEQLLKKYLDQDVSEGHDGEELKAIDGDYYEDSTDFFSQFEQDHFDREEESADGMEIRGYIDDECVMVFKFSTPDMMGGWGNYDDSALMSEGHDHEDDEEEGETCPECDGAGCPECYGDEHRDRAHDHAQGTQRESADGAAGVKYGVFAKGGSVGSQRFRDDPLKTFDTKEEAIADARRRRSGLSQGERGYYRIGYVVKPIQGVTEGDVDDFVAGGGKITQVKPNKGPRRSGVSLGSKHIGTVRGGKASSISGKRANTRPTIKPVVAVEQQVDEKSEAVRHGNNDHNVYHHVDESVDPIEQLRADIRRFSR